ncbi:MAG: PAS domain-containing protein [Deltaproteobacteria bacterium]|nr:PAS domain-containing protein [Deltaproteobacteria bacterium]
MKDVRRWIRVHLWDEVPVRICVIDRDFRIVTANRAFGRELGRWYRRPCHVVLRGRDAPCSPCSAVACFRDGRIRNVEEQGVPRDGAPTWYYCQMIPMVRPNGAIPYIVEMSTDITAIKRLEHGKIEAERLAAVGQTVAGLAHGIKNVLMGLDGGMYVVRSGLERGDAGRIAQGWQMLEGNVARIGTFVRDFLEFARGRVPRVQLVEPNAVVRDVVASFAEAARRAGIALRADLEPDVGSAMMDPDGLHTCLANLVSNALDACQVSDKARRHVWVTTADRAGVLVIEVSDDGAGMDYDVQKKAFSTFFSTKAVGKGTGLGLLTTRKIAQEHGGRVSFETREGKGSVVRLEFPRDRLPRLEPEAATDAGTTAAPRPPRRASGR